MSRARLGRGLSSLIPEAAEGPSLVPPLDAGSEKVIQIPIREIKANPNQPRRVFDEAALDELTASVKEQGILQPILVRPDGDRYEIVMGERRFRAASRAGLKKVPAIVRDIEARESLEIALIENLQREDLNPVEEAEAFQRMIDELGYSQSELSRRVGKDRSSISNALRLLKLPPEVLDGLARGDIAMGHGRALLALGGEEEILTLYGTVVSGHLSVRQTEDAVRRLNSGRKPRAKAKEPTGPMVDLQERLARYLGTGVKLKPRARGEGGKVVMEYYNIKDLNRLIERIEDHNA